MRLISIFILMLLGIQTFGQTKPFKQWRVHLDSIPAKGEKIAYWKYHEGDNPQWKEHNFDDTKWGIIKASDSYNDLKHFNKKSIGWLRTTLHKDTLPQTIAIAISQVAASEVFINGKKIKSFGIIGKKAETTIGFNPIRTPFVVSLDKDTVQVIAVRIAKPANVPENGGTYFPTHLFSLRVYNPNDAFVEALNDRTDEYLWSIVKGSIFFILFIIHASFYKIQKDQLTNLFFALFTFANATNESIYLFIAYFNTNVAIYSTFNALNLLLTSGSNIFFMLAIYSQFEVKRKWNYWVLIGGFLGLPFTYLINSIFGLCTYIVLSIWLYIQLTVFAVDAISQKKRGAKVLSFGIFSVIATCNICFFALIFLTISEQQEMTDWVVNFFSQYIAHFKDVVMSVCLSIYLALEFSYINKTLNYKLIEIQHLSHEKQQLLESQNEKLERKVSARTAQLHHSLTELKTTQNQLIQKEKLASLGELTAGIAHEIQNPLNFVNNFSELSVELAQELIEELEKPEIDKLYLAEILGDLTKNQAKINHHGKRASSIVSGMLEHSRTSTGERVMTDINKLADEYLRLSYHGMRAKNSNFQADYELIIDENLPLIKVVPQDMGRVLLNLINNAFYAVASYGTPPAKLSHLSEYSPKVIVSTAFSPPYGGGLGDRRFGGVEIRVKDNGNGIPADILPKIFQPFFTTKPTGEGTGLGLSLSYDIITKGHGGTIEVESVQGEGTTFVVRLPIT